MNRALKHGGKPWHFLFITHNAVMANKTFAALAAAHGGGE